MSENEKFTVGVLVVSDSCAAKLAQDQSGLNLQEIVNKQSNYVVTSYDIVPDDRHKIKEKLIEWSDRNPLDLILTTGGTGFAPTDITPEATKDVIHKEACSLTNTILIESLKITKFAALSRGIAGIRHKSLIVNLPGSKKGSQEALEIVLPVLKHALDLLRESKRKIENDHKIIQGAPPHSNPNPDHKHDQHHHHHHHHHHHDKRHESELKSRITDKDIADRPRKSAYPMISVEQAVQIILDQSRSLPSATEEIQFADSLNRICAADIVARDPLPPFAASVKDGFAVRLTGKQKSYIQNRSNGGKSGGGGEEIKWVFNVVGASNAGDGVINMELNEGECVKINTGAPVPLKADAVVQIEDTRALEKNSTTGLDSVIEIVESSGCGGGSGDGGHIDIKLGQDIRPIGFDIASGQVVVKRGMVMRPAQLGICATVGALRVQVYRSPRVGLISTGNELCNADGNNGEKLSSGKIRDSNKPLLRAALKAFGALDANNVIDAGIATDDCDTVLKVFRNALQTCDVVISTGGVSMGDKDLVKDVLEKDLKCTIHFARMNMKPGKPTTFATCEMDGKKKLIFCLPGNPVSAIVTFNLVVVPCLKTLVGYRNPFFREIKVKIEFDAELDPRPEYHRCLLEWPSNETNESSRPSAFSTGNQHSSRLLSMNEANCLVKLPPRSSEKQTVNKGEILSALLIDNI